MHIENISYDKMSLDRNGQSMLIQVYEKEIYRLNNIIKKLEKELREGSFDVYFCSANTQKTFKSNEIIIKSLILDKLKALKEGK